jgi:hypothetical protein
LPEVPSPADSTVVPDAVRVLVAEGLVPFRVYIGDHSFIQRWFPAAGQCLVAEIVLVLVYQQIAGVCEDIREIRVVCALKDIGALILPQNAPGGGIREGPYVKVELLVILCGIRLLPLHSQLIRYLLPVLKKPRILLAAPHVLSQDLPQDDIALLLSNSYDIQNDPFLQFEKNPALSERWTMWCH